MQTSMRAKFSWKRRRPKLRSNVLRVLRRLWQCAGALFAFVLVCVHVREIAMPGKARCTSIRGQDVSQMVLRHARCCTSTHAHAHTLSHSYKHLSACS